MSRSCAFCGAEYGANRSDSRFCSSACRSRARREGLPATPPVAGTGDTPEHPVVVATRRELRALRALDSTEGATALLYAEMVATQGGSMTGRATAGARLTELMEKIRRDSDPPVMDPIDALRSKVMRRQLERKVEVATTGSFTPVPGRSYDPDRGIFPAHWRVDPDPGRTG